MFLSALGDRETIRLDNPIVNDSRSGGGKTAPLLYGTPGNLARVLLEDVARDKSKARTTDLKRREGERESGQG